ncbi:MAG TPA: hypothetical protein ENN07_03920, partial [candidate division Zixibacteria bacterium]|nr:hypothetical protein [candidate division Zixibacteria bacterium]
MRNLIIFTIAITAASVFAVEFPEAMPREALMGVDKLESVDGNFHESADIFSCYFDGAKLRVRLPMMVDFRTGINEFERRDVSLEIDLNGELTIFVSSNGAVRASGRGDAELLGVDFMPKWGTIDFFIERRDETRPRIEVRSFIAGKPADEAVFGPKEEPLSAVAHCAFVLHGNQSVSYTDVFRGRFGAEDESGFDEILEAHQTHSIPGNFHISGTLQSAADWYDPAFNNWISAGVVAGWAEIITSAYAQHIMPFVTDAMNNWAVSIENDMIQYRYGYTPRVGWVPERTFLDGPGGAYPNDGVIDWIANNFTENGVWAVILDDDPHLRGYDNCQIHTQEGSGLRLIPRHDAFTGNMHAGNGAGALAILQGLRDSGHGDYRIAVYADDWEMPASIGEWEHTMPHALGTYRWMIQQCSIESSWLNVWKLTNAVENPNFNGETFTITYGAHPSIGGADGYGGDNNAWYRNWASYPSPSDHRGHDFGTIWWSAQDSLMSAPNNNTSQSAWFVLMSKLYETAWHDCMGCPISGWQIRHSSHIKNANAYTKASWWTAGLRHPDCGAFYADWDNNGDNELVIHNDRVMAVFKHIGGRAHWIFAKGGATGWEGSIAGNCNVYWEGTDGDYNDANHIAPLSDVAVASWDYQHSLYYSNIDYANADSAQITLGNYLLKKTIKIKRDQPFFLVHYDTGPDVIYTRSGFTPDLVDVIWNAQLDRLWGAGYAGWHNPNTRATAALVLGSGGASHSTEFQSTLLKGDEVTGRGGFGYYIFAGELSDVTGLTSPTLNSLATGLTDIFPPRAYTASYHPGTAILEISFGDVVRYDEVSMSLIGIDANGNGTSDVMLDETCIVINTSNARKIRIQLSPVKASAVAGLSMTNPHIHLQTGAFKDLSGNGNRTQTATIGDAVQLHILPNMSITIDGWIDTTEWVHATRVLDDPNDDSDWGAGNEIYDLNLFWDETYLYLGLHGVKEVSPTTNSWLIYIDTHQPTGGATDLTAIDNWNRGASFAGGFKAHIQYGSWGAMDGDVWRILTPTSSVQITEGVIARTDLSADRPGSEVAISWDAIYDLGAGIVPPNARISVCASFAGSSDGDPLGGDCVPNHITATFPVLDNFYTQIIDADGDGIPDDFFTVVHVAETKLVLPGKISISAFPNPFNSSVFITAPEGAEIEIFDVNGKIVDYISVGEGPRAFPLDDNAKNGSAQGHSP